MAVDAGTVYSEVRIQLDKLRGDIRQVQTTMDRIGPISRRASDTVSQSWVQGFNKIKLVSAAAFAAVGLAIKAATSTFAGFEQSLANVQSVARATPADFAKLEEAAKRAGETTRFTASQAADAMYFLASAGFDATESVAALDGVLNLAGATQSDLAFTSSAVAAAISQFSLDASDSTRVANVFTASIQNSQATMEKLATSMSYVGPVASGLGYSLEETAGILQILYNNGFEASTAGTALRSALSDLANETSPAIKKLAELGVEFSEVDPAANKFGDIMDRLAEAGVTAGDAMAIFGDRAGGSILKLIQAGSAEINEYTDAVTDTNAAAEAYAIQNDTLSGSVDRFKSVLEATSISISENFEGAFRGLVDFAGKLVGIFGKLPGPVQAFLTILAAGIPTLLAAGSAIAFMSTALAGAGVALGAILGPIALVTTVIAGVAAGFVAHSNAIQENLRALEEHKALVEETAAAIDELNNAQTESAAIARLERATLLANSPLRAAARREYEELGNAANLYAADLRQIAERETELAQIRNEDVLPAAHDELELLIAHRAQLRENAEANATIISIVQDRIDTVITLIGELENQSSAQGELNEQIRQWNRLQSQRRDKTDEEKIRQLRILQVLQEHQVDLREEEYEDREHLRDLNLRVIAAELKAEQEAQAERDRLNAERIAGMDEVAAEEERRAIQSTAGIVAMVTAQRNLAAEVQKAREAEEAAAKAAEKRAQTVEEQATAQEAVNAILDEYDTKLLQLTGSQEDLQAAEQGRVAATLRAAGVSEDAIDQVIAKVREYQDVLADKTAAEEMAEGIKQATDLAFEYLDQLGDLMLDIIDVMTERRLAAFDADLRSRLAAIDQELAAELEANDLAEESTIERYQRELEEARKAGDEEAIILAERNLRRAELEKEYADKRAAIEADLERKRAEIEYKGALNSWRVQLLMAIVQGIQAALNAYSSTAAIPVVGPALAPAAAAIAGAFGAASVGLIAAQRPEPPQLATGGIVLPSRGGVPTVQAENGFPELSLNGGPEGLALRRAFARDIANAMGGGGMTVLLDIDGQRVSQAVVDRVNNGQVRLRL